MTMQKFVSYKVFSKPYSYVFRKNHWKNHLDKSEPNVIVYLLSGGVLGVHPVKGEALWWIIGKGRVDHGAGVGAGIHVDNFLK